MWLLFAPWESYFDKKLAAGYEGNKFLRGNFAAVDVKGDKYEAIDIVSGAVPADLNGVYVRVGPNPSIVPKNGRQHWFDGDGMLCAVRIKAGKVFYCNR